ncbi:NRDE family protein [Paenibacillus aurantius]|uniref:NRDE family protein n=1 Tax=Paenibacillus aurantius TaxID=2918900 RepID=A0AA96LMR3_9BACL|nr:NRDE family protein [Paenibacillus aurantius]WNQ14027.1 NRDE family protein [Paenibacillus aurantius]
MCLILFAYRIHPEYHLILGANRDEFYNRPTALANYWDDYPNILAGRDLTKMGTWLGVTKKGRFAALTNYRNPEEEGQGKKSRGELVADFLKGHKTPEAFMSEAKQKRNSYPGYNLLTGDANELYYYSNVEDEVRRLEPGIYGVSNHLLDTSWPKVTHGKAGLANLLHRNDLVEQLFELLRNETSFPDEILPRTGVSLEWERLLSPLFVKSDGYGTRCSTILLLTDETLEFKERTYSIDGMKEQEFTIRK